MATSRLRVGDQEFGSVFKRPGHGGPKYIRGSARYPSWSDPRTPGNTDPNMEASKIMARWTPQQMKRFEYFMDQHKVDMTPWKKEWLDKTAPGHNKQREDIIKCKLELIKRILKIKMTGPQSMEDWCLYFLYYDDKLDIPQDVETLIRPDWSEVGKLDWYNNTKTINDEFPYLVRDSRRNIRYPGNLFMPGFEEGQGDVPMTNSYPLYEEPRGPRTRLTESGGFYFPSRLTNREVYQTGRTRFAVANRENLNRHRFYRMHENF